jgi:putative two-component system response regulator
MMHTANRILAVDDNPTNLAIIEESLQGRFNLRTASDGKEALRLTPSFHPDLILLDAMMPSPDGFEVCSRIKNNRAIGPTQIVMVSARTDINSRLRGYQAGADDYMLKPFNEEELYAKVCVNLRTRSACSSIHSQVESVCGAVGETLKLVSQLRDAENAGHLVRMRDYAQLLAVELQTSSYGNEIDELFLDDLYQASPLHDIGKVAIPDAILLKPGPLTDAEFTTMQKHTLVGEHILKRLAQQQPHVSMFSMAVQIARSHHECFDGSGYPDGLSGRSIPLAAHIVKVADVFDAITSTRVYKPKQHPNEAREWITARTGAAFDPLIIAAFQQQFDAFSALANDHDDEFDAAEYESFEF